MAINNQFNQQNQEDEQTEQSGVNSNVVNNQQTPQQPQQSTQQQSQSQNVGSPVQPVTSANQQTVTTQTPQKFGALNNITSNQSQQPSRPKNQQTGTGFTNLNRIMEANQGNRLGQTVAGGITSNVSNLQSGVNQAQQDFTTQSQANRIDTEENAAKRAGVLSRFDESQYNVDESQFQLGQEFQDEYDQKQQTLQDELTGLEDKFNLQNAPLQEQINYNQKALDIANKLQRNSTIEYGVSQGYDRAGNYMGTRNVRKYDLSVLTPEEREIYNRVVKGMGGFQGSVGNVVNTINNTHKKALNSLLNVQKLQEALRTGQQTDLESRLEELASNFTGLTEREKQAWIQSEKNRMVRENLPNVEETEQFRIFSQGAYSGPKELENYGSLLGQAQQVEDLGQLSRLQGGRQELLKQFVGGRDYTAGQRNLDEAILGQSDNSLLSRAAKKALGSENLVQSANRQASAEAQDLTNRARQFGEETRQAIEQTRNPLSAQIDRQVQDLYRQEETRQNNLNTLQSILSGTDESTQHLDENARLGLAIQMAQDSGYLSNEDVAALVSKGGLLDRGRNLGMDLNQMISERLSGTGAVGIDRKAAATEDQETRISALDRLLGKTGTDVEFNRSPDMYQAGTIGLDTGNLIDHILKTENERLQSDSGYSESLEQQGITPLQQYLSGIYGNTVGMATDPLAYLNDPSLYGQNLLNTGAGAAGMMTDINASALKGLNNLLGGNKEIDKLISGYENLQKSGISGVYNEGANLISAVDDLKSGRIDQLLSKVSGLDTVKNVGGNIQREVSKAITNVGKAISTALSGGKTGDWHPDKYNTTDYATGKSVKIGSFANKSSDEILNQILNVQLNRVNIQGRNQSGIQGSKEMNRLLEFYFKALERENK